MVVPLRGEMYPRFIESSRIIGHDGGGGVGGDGILGGCRGGCSPTHN